MADMRRIVEIDDELCDGCGLCALACAEGALEIRDGKAHIISDSYCDGLGACLSGCPTGAVRIIEREADEFDPEAVEEHLSKAGKTSPEGLHSGAGAGNAIDAGKGDKPEKAGEFTMACGCPSSKIEMFSKDPVQEDKASPAHMGVEASHLSHWPIQIRLVPPTAPFLKGADLLVVSDCAPIAYPNFHRDFVRGKAVLLGCPKFDNAQEYIAKFAEIFRKADIRSVTVVDMEVPCCSAMPLIVRKGMSDAGVEIPIREVVISVRGKVIKEGGNAA